MIKLMLKLGLSIPVILGIAATGVQIDADDIDNEAMRVLASGWNSLAENLHDFVVDHDDEVIDMSKKFASNASDKAMDAIVKAGEFVDDNRDDIKDMAEKAGEKFGQVISDDD